MKKVLSVILAILPFVIVFISSLYTNSDPDLGWHLKNGEHFFRTGQILRDNTYSTLMPDYKWANTSWGTDLITYAIYYLGGFLGLTIFSALTVTATFYFFSKAAKLTNWDQVFIFPLLLFVESPVNSVSFRGQQISLLLLGVLFYILSLYKKNSKVVYIAIPLFFLWANLHGQFILGLIMFFGWIAVYVGQNFWVSLRAKRSNIIGIGAVISWLGNDKRESIFLVTIFICSCLITMLNPFGIGIHRDAIAHIGSPLLKNISEYLPFPSLSQAWWNQVFVAVLLTIGVIYMSIKRKFMTKFPFLVSALFLYFLSFSVRRFAWPAYYLVLPVLQPIPGFFKPDSKKIADISAGIMLVILLVIITAGKLPLTQYADFNWDDYCKHKFILCSPKAAEYVKENKLTNNLYSVYGWGGHLIWNYPEIKPTIDGRMHMWRDESGYSGFEDYYAIEQNIQDIDKSKYNAALMSPEKPAYNRLVELVNSKKWKLVYQDSYAGVFVRN